MPAVLAQYFKVGAAAGGGKVKKGWLGCLVGALTATAALFARFGGAEVGAVRTFLLLLGGTSIALVLRLCGHLRAFGVGAARVKVGRGFVFDLRGRAVGVGLAAIIGAFRIGNLLGLLATTPQHAQSIANRERREREEKKG